MRKRNNTLTGFMVVIFGMAAAQIATAGTIRLFYNIFGLPSSVIQPKGAARPVEGPIGYGDAFLRQDFVYRRTGVLMLDIVWPGASHSTHQTITAGRRLYALGGGPLAAWCTVPEADKPDLCIASDGDGYYARPGQPPRLDPLRFVDLSYLKNGQTIIALGRELPVSETPGATAPMQTLEIVPVRADRGHFNFQIRDATTHLSGPWAESFGLYPRLFAAAARDKLRGGLIVTSPGNEKQTTAVVLNYDPANDSFMARFIER